MGKKKKLKRSQVFHVIGLTGTNGAGKGSVVEVLVSRYGAKHLSIREFFKEEATKRGVLLQDREAILAFGKFFRGKYGPGHLIRTITKKVKRRAGGLFVSLFVIESLRCPGEIEYLSERFGDRFTLIGVDAPVILRHGRSRVRGTMTDNVDFDEFVRLERLENWSINPWEQNLSICADMVAPRFRIWNQWTTKYLRRRVREIADEIGLERC